MTEIGSFVLRIFSTNSGVHQSGNIGEYGSHFFIWDDFAGIEPNLKSGESI